jgi:hypothetical protein
MNIRLLLLVAGGPLAVSAALSRPVRRRYLTWGATPAEVTGPLPDDELPPPGSLVTERGMLGVKQRVEARSPAGIDPATADAP